MAGEHHPGAPSDLLPQRACQHVDAHRVQPAEGLVEDEQVGRVDERHPELDALLVAQGEVVDRAVDPLREAQPFDPAVGAVLRRRAVQAGEPGEVHQLVADAHLRVETALLRHVAETEAGGRVDGTAPPAHLAAVGSHHAHHRPHGGRLAGPVAADEADHAPRRDVERDVVEGDDVAVATVQPLDLQHGLHLVVGRAIP